MMNKLKLRKRVFFAIIAIMVGFLLYSNHIFGSNINVFFPNDNSRIDILIFSYIYNFTALIFAPIIEELIFRMGLIRNNTYLKIVSFSSLILIAINEISKLFIEDSISLLIPIKPSQYLTDIGIFKPNSIVGVFIHYLFWAVIVGILFYVSKLFIKHSKINLDFINSKKFTVAYFVISTITFWSWHFTNEFPKFDVFNIFFFFTLLGFSGLFYVGGLRLSILGHALFNTSQHIIQLRRFTLESGFYQEYIVLILLWIVLFVGFIKVAKISLKQ